MKIGILGSGNVGKTLSEGFVKHGHEAMIGTRSPEKLSEWASDKRIKVGNFSETANFGDIVVLSVKGRHAEEAMKLAGHGTNGKVIIDTTNPINETASPVNGVLKFFTTLDNSLMEQLQTAFPKARFVKAFSCIGAPCMVNPDFSEKPTMFICGNDIDAKKQVSGILHAFGFDVDDLGNAEAARAIEPLCILWCIPGFQKNDWYHGLRMMRKG